MVERGGLLTQQEKKLLLHLHPSERTYLPLPGPGPSSCLSLSCASLHQCCARLTVPEDLGVTRQDDSLARHFLLRLWGIDQDQLGLEPENLGGVFGYAAMFQFLLDFWSLAVARRGGSLPTFPGRPGGDHKPFDSCRLLEPAAGWRTAAEILVSLQEDYWARHPLLPGPRALRLHPEQEEDRQLWGRVGRVLAGRAGGREEVKVLTEAMAVCFTRLEKVHKQFNEDLGRLAKRKGLLNLCTVS
jgi:hypothetical protein